MKKICITPFMLLTTLEFSQFAFKVNFSKVKGIKFTLLFLTILLNLSCSNSKSSDIESCGDLTFISANYIEDHINSFDEDGYFNIVVEGGVPPYSYSYEPINETASEFKLMDDNKLFKANPGKYKFTVKDSNGCEVSKTSIKEGFVILYSISDPLYFGGYKITWDISQDASMSNYESGSVSFGGHEYSNYTHHRISLFSQYNANKFFTEGISTITEYDLDNEWKIQFDTVTGGKWGIRYSTDSVSHDKQGNIIVTFKGDDEGYMASYLKLNFNNIILESGGITKILNGTIAVEWYDGE